MQMLHDYCQSSDARASPPGNLLRRVNRRDHQASGDAPEAQRIDLSLPCLEWRLPPGYNATVSRLPARARFVSTHPWNQVMEDGDPIRYFLEVRDLKDKGYEVVVSLVNEGEDWLHIRGVVVDITKDGESFGRHEVSFPQADHSGHFSLDQFEVGEGHFHLAQDLSHQMMNVQVFIDYKYGDHRETQKISRRVETQQFRKGI